MNTNPKLTERWSLAEKAETLIDFDVEAAVPDKTENDGKDSDTENLPR